MLLRNVRDFKTKKEKKRKRKQHVWNEAIMICDKI